MSRPLLLALVFVLLSPAPAPASTEPELLEPIPRADALRAQIRELRQELQGQTALVPSHEAKMRSVLTRRQAFEGYRGLVSAEQARGIDEEYRGLMVVYLALRQPAVQRAGAYSETDNRLLWAGGYDQKQMDALVAESSRRAASLQRNQSVSVMLQRAGRLLSESAPSAQTPRPAPAAAAPEAVPTATPAVDCGKLCGEAELRCENRGAGATDNLGCAAARNAAATGRCSCGG